MSEIDLIPPDYAREQSLRLQLRRALVLVLTLGCLVALARSGLGILIAADEREVSRLQAKKLLWQQSKTRTEEYANKAQVTEKQLRALDELRGRDHVRLLLDGLDEAHVEKVWFDEIRYYRSERQPRSKDAPGQPQRAAPVVEQRVAMIGHAVNHVTLAEFMRKLERQPGIAEVNLLDTSPRTYLSGMVIDFKLVLLVDQKAPPRP